MSNPIICHSYSYAGMPIISILAFILPVVTVIRYAREREAMGSHTHSLEYIF
ncbi:hypothetical protein I5677_04515 [Mobilitalea sibirica]|uniref:Uncharacterized protein n=1 Tax=Mobilitalea sibirica TaxID=1462919 RepID=A0A8J7H1E2_9FIRM|nr:hypothetical protein [Mobilitalea sibirica]MBH1940157.1 hypothetical protein [Mobilitalea sibirica]